MWLCHAKECYTVPTNVTQRHKVAITQMSQSHKIPYSARKMSHSGIKCPTPEKCHTQSMHRQRSVTSHSVTKFIHRQRNYLRGSEFDCDACIEASKRVATKFRGNKEQKTTELVANLLKAYHSMVSNVSLNLGLGKRLCDSWFWPSTGGESRIRARTEKKEVDVD